MDNQRQVSLFEESDSVVEIKKSSSLVQMNNVTTLHQRKAINSLIRIAKDQLKRNPEATTFSVDLWIIKKLSGISRNDNTELKQSLKALVSLVIEYNILGKEKYERGAFPFLSVVKITGQVRGNTSRLTFEFPSPILDAIKRPAMYVKLNMFIRRGLNSKHSLALYEVLKDYQNIGKIRIEIENFRKLVGVEGQYKIFTMLKKRIVDVAVDEINEKTDLKVVYDLEKEGRKITAIVFRVNGIAKYETGEKLGEEIMQKLRSMGIREATAKELLEKHDEDYILANIGLVEEELVNGKKIHNIPAYLMKAFEVDFRPVETEHEKTQKAKQQSQRLGEQAEAEHQKQRVELLKKFERQKVALVNDLLKSIAVGDFNALKAEFMAKIEGNPLFKKVLETKGFASAVIQSQRTNFLAEGHLPKAASDFGEFLKIEGYDTTDGNL